MALENGASDVHCTRAISAFSFAVIDLHRKSGSALGQCV